MRRVLGSANQEIAAFGYDFADRRVRKSAGGATVEYAYAGERVVEEYADAGQVLATYDFGLDLVRSELGAEGATWYFTDALGSATALGAVDGGGAHAVGYNGYDAWGGMLERAAGTSNRVGFTGQREDTETGLLALGNGARYYAPDAGRFVQQDSWEGVRGVPQSLNRFAYALGNPAGYTDPSGHVPESVGGDAATMAGSATEGMAPGKAGGIPESWLLGHGEQGREIDRWQFEGRNASLHKDAEDPIAMLEAGRAQRVADMLGVLNDTIANVDQVAQWVLDPLSTGVTAGAELIRDYFSVEKGSWADWGLDVLPYAVALAPTTGLAYRGLKALTKAALRGVVRTVRATKQMAAKVGAGAGRLYGEAKSGLVSLKKALRGEGETIAASERILARETGDAGRDILGPKGASESRSLIEMDHEFAEGVRRDTEFGLDLRDLVRDDAAELIADRRIGGVAVSRAAVPGGLISDRFVNFLPTELGVPKLDRISYVAMGDANKTFRITDIEAYMIDLKRGYAIDGGLHGALEAEIRGLVAANQDFASQAWLPGAHAEVRALNWMYKEMDKLGIPTSTPVWIATYKIQKGRGQGLGFATCSNCDFILQRHARVPTGWRH